MCKLSIATRTLGHAGWQSMRVENGALLSVVHCDRESRLGRMVPMCVRATCLMLMVCSLLRVVSAQESKPCNGPGGATRCNGVSVGAPKVFDNRSLILMLEALNQTLEAQQRTYIDQK